MVTLHPQGIDLTGRGGQRGQDCGQDRGEDCGQEPGGEQAAGLLRSGLATAGLLSGGELRSREEARETVASGFRAVDSLLPAGGLRRGSLVEWLAGGETAAGDVAGGAGAVSLACAVACRLGAAAAGPRTIVVVDRGGWFHPPAVLPWLIDSQQLFVARPSHDDDEIWAIDQALRCRGVAAVVAWPRGAADPAAWCSRGSAAEAGGRRAGSRPGSAWTTALRRWQLAARSSGVVGLLVRPAAAAGEPSWAEARIVVSPLPGGTLFERRLRLERVGGAWSGGLEGRAAEMVLDLARGREGQPPRGAVQGHGRPHPREQIDGRPTGGRGGASCRAS